MNAPVLWIAIPAFVSLFLFLIKHKKSRELIYIFSSAVFLILTLFIKIDSLDSESIFSLEISSTLNILGRSFILHEEDKFLIQLIYLINIVWGIAILLFKKQSLIIPFGLIFSAFLLAAVSVEPFLYSALIIEIAVILSIPLIMDINNKNKKGIIRYLIYQTLAMPFILLAGWFLAGGEINPVNPEQLIQATLLLGLGFFFWLGIFPFHSWVPMVFEETDPMNSGFILLLLQTFSFVLIIKYINGFAWLRDYVVFFQALRFLGIVMAVFGSIGFFFQKNIRKMIGYELLHSVGVILISIGLSYSRGIGLFSFLIGSRLVIFPLLFFSTSYLIQKEKNLTVLNFGKIAQENPIAGAAFIFSMLSLAGMPLTLGFPPLQTMYQFLALDYTYILVLLIFSISLNTIIVFKLIKDILKIGNVLKNLEIIDRENIYLVSLLTLLVLNGFFPRLILTQFENLVAGFGYLIK